MRAFLVAFSFAVLASCTPPPPQCGPSTCAGCCDASGQCVGGNAPTACGWAGSSCQACPGGTSCQLGSCVVISSSGGGGGSTGGGGGSTMGGGGGTTGGGSGSPGTCAGTTSRCAGACVDVLSSADHCGSCGRTCASGEVCNRGVCELLPMDCTAAGASCAPGYQCSPTTRQCIPGCARSVDCPMGAACNAGTCACPTGQHACGQQCTLDSSIGSCGSSCEACPAPPANATPTCDGTQCGFTCNTGFHRCGDLCVRNDSVATCGQSCSPCPASPANGTATCDGTQCGFSCSSGFHACGAACVSNNSTSSCGTSCTACAVPSNGMASCDGTSCGLSCNTGFHQCGSTCRDDTSPQSCGSSCTPCATPSNGVATCSAGQCGVSCNTDFHPCASGCCAWSTVPLRAESPSAIDVEVGDGGTVFVLQGYFGAANQGKILMTTVALDGGLSTTSAFSTTNPTQGVDVSMAARGNVVHAAWSFNYPPPAGGSYSTDVRYGSFRNGGWSTQVLRSANVLPFANAVATVMLQSTPHVLIAFNQEVVDVTVSGSSPSQVVASDAGIYSLGAASNGPLMVAALFGSPSGSLHSISSSGSSWSPRTAIEPTGSFLAYPPGVAVDALGRAHVAYVDELRARPRYALLQNGTWTREDVENLQMGYSIDLDVDRAGNPHVCFVTGTPGNVRYGVKRNGAWRMENVTTVGNGPSRCAIAVGPADEVYIVISDPGGLRLAR